MPAPPSTSSSSPADPTAGGGDRLPRMPRMPRWKAGLFGAILLGGLITIGYVARNDPAIHLLIPESGASWIRKPRPFELSGSAGTLEVVFYRAVVTIPEGIRPVSPAIQVKAFRSCSIYWDGILLHQGMSPGQLRQLQYNVAEPYYRQWKKSHSITLPADLLAPGRHELLIAVNNGRGPTALLAHCAQLRIQTGPHWECRYGDKAWQPAADATQVILPELSRKFPGTATALVESLKWLFPAFVLAWVALGWLHRSALANDRWPPVAIFRWCLMAAWGVLAVRNFSRVPLDMGYDLAGHVAYIKYILENHSLPLATDGPQMFQTPLYYILSAVMHAILSLFVSTETAWQSLKWLPLLCGIAQVELCYRAAVAIFPERRDLQNIALLVGGLLPMNIVMSQSLSNEPLCGVLVGAVLVMCLKGIVEPAFIRRTRNQLLLGLLLGLAILTKVSALLLVVPVGLVFVTCLRSEGSFEIAIGQFRWMATAALVCGWFFVRNWIHLDQLIIGGWDPVTQIVWWQDPGYRTPQQMLSFGQSLFHPIHAGFYSIWDGFYSTLWLDGNLSAQGTWETRPPWNYNLMLSAPWLAVALSAGIVAGLVRGVRAQNQTLRTALRFAGGTLSLYLLAFAWLGLTVPVYSQAKASYTLGLTPLYALLCAAGFDLLPRHWLVRSAAWAFLATWCVSVYSTYFAW